MKSNGVPAPQHSTTTLSAADKAAHAAASYVRPLPHRTPGAIRRAVEVERAYAERARQLRAEVTADKAEAGVL